MQIRVLAAALSLVFAASCKKVSIEETINQVKVQTDAGKWPEAEIAMKPLLDDQKLMVSQPRLNALAYLVKSNTHAADTEIYLNAIKGSDDPAILAFLARNYFDQKDYVNAALYYKNIYGINANSDALKMLILSDYLRSGADIESFVKSNGEGLRILKTSSPRSAEYLNLVAIDAFYNDPSNKAAMLPNLYKAKGAGPDHLETILNMAVIEDAANKRYGSAERFYNEYLAAAGANISPDIKAKIDARLIKLKELNKAVKPLPPIKPVTKPVVKKPTTKPVIKKPTTKPATKPAAKPAAR
jgi:hypothetical protein